MGHGEGKEEQVVHVGMDKEGFTALLVIWLSAVGLAVWFLIWCYKERE